jgi:hypothetical protein
VPEEFAAAYREAYRRALETGPEAGPEPGIGTDGTAGADLVELPPQEAVLVGNHRTGEEPASRSPLARWRGSPWFLGSVAAAGALVLVLAAYAVGTSFSGDDPGADGTAVPQSSRTNDPSRSSESPKSPPTKATPSSSPGGWEGRVTAVPVDAIAADCTAPPGSDSAGHKVTYVPGNAADGKTQTAWRCDGTAVGQKLTLRIAGEANIAEVGLIPGYAKTDPGSGVDRYAENNRITKVRWTLGDGESIVQRLDPDPTSRAVQVLRVPPTTTDTIMLEILAVKHGPRNTTAISEISLAETAS